MRYPFGCRHLQNVCSCLGYSTFSPPVCSWLARGVNLACGVRDDGLSPTRAFVSAAIPGSLARLPPKSANLHAFAGLFYMPLRIYFTCLCGSTYFTCLCGSILHAFVDLFSQIDLQLFIPFFSCSHPLFSTALTALAARLSAEPDSGWARAGNKRAKPPRFRPHIRARPGPSSRGDPGRALGARG